LAGSVGILLLRSHRLALRSPLQPWDQTGAAIHLLEINRGGIFAGPVAEQVIVVGDYADTY